VVVAGIVNAIAREKVQKSASIRGKEFGSYATLVTNVHLEQVQEPCPLRIDVIRIEGVE
jgi:hypothetical protein